MPSERRPIMVTEEALHTLVRHLKAASEDGRCVELDFYGVVVEAKFRQDLQLIEFSVLDRPAAERDPGEGGPYELVHLTTVMPGRAS